MRICFISHGQLIHIDAYLDFFKTRGDDVHFISLTPSPPKQVPTYNMGFGKYTVKKGKWKYLLSAMRIRRLVRKLKPDIVHAHYATSGGLAGLVCGFHPFVVTVHGSDLTLGIKSRIWKPLLKAIFNHADCVNTVSEDLKEMALTLGISAEKIKVITPGIDTENFSFVEKGPIDEEQPLRLICTRRLEPVFNHQTIIEALATLKSKGVRFHMTLVGDGTLKEKLEQLVREKQLAGQVTFLGQLDNSKLPQVLQQNDVYLSASLWDGTSLSLLEAMATGLFPVVSDIKANKAWLKNNVNGLLHRVTDAEDLADKILRLRGNPKLTIQAAKTNRRLVVTSGDRKTNLKQVEKIYEQLCRN